MHYVTRCKYFYIYVYMYICVNVYIYIYIYIPKGRSLFPRVLPSRYSPFSYVLSPTFPSRSYSLLFPHSLHSPSFILNSLLSLTLFYPPRPRSPLRLSSLLSVIAPSSLSLLPLSFTLSPAPSPPRLLSLLFSLSPSLSPSSPSFPPLRSPKRFTRAGHNRFLTTCMPYRKTCLQYRVLGVFLVWPK